MARKNVFSRKTTGKWGALAALGMGVCLAGCGPSGSSTASSGESLTGSIAADGSSTVGPITMAVSEEFLREQPAVRVTVGVSGTGGGFKKFIAGDISIQNASRPIKEQEAKELAGKGIGYIELPIAYDGLVVAVNPKNDWATCLTAAELKKIWEPNSKVQTWRDVKPQFPAKPVKLYGPDPDSGTFDYFTEAINGKEGAIRREFTPSSDDNVLVQGVSQDPAALGYFGLAYYEENQDKLKLVSVDGGSGCVEPSVATVNSGTYKPLSRPLFIYVREDAAAQPAVQAFVKFYLENAGELVKSVGYVPLPDELYQAALQRFEKRVTGTIYKTDADKAKSLQELL